MRRNGKWLEMEEYYIDLRSMALKKCGDSERLPHISKVIFNPPATIVLWGDGTKTVVKCQMCGACIGNIDAELAYHPCYDPEKGLAMCIAKKALGNKGNYYNEFKRWLEEWR